MYLDVTFLPFIGFLTILFREKITFFHSDLARLWLAPLSDNLRWLPKIFTIELPFRAWVTQWNLLNHVIAKFSLNRFTSLTNDIRLLFWVPMFLRDVNVATWSLSTGRYNFWPPMKCFHSSPHYGDDIVWLFEMVKIQGRSFGLDSILWFVIFLNIIDLFI